MKIRNGFVSNSSSSSFIVAFKRLPETVEELKEMLFGDNNFVSFYDEKASALEVASRVFNDLAKQAKDLSVSEVIDRAASGVLYYDNGSFLSMLERNNSISWYEFYKEEEDKVDQQMRDKYGANVDRYTINRDKDHKIISAREKKRWQKKIDDAHKKADEKHKTAVNDFVKKWLKENPKSKIRIFHYSDNQGETLLEHGEIFAALPNLRISHH
jgi:hypothetical protein